MDTNNINQELIRTINGKNQILHFNSQNKTGLDEMKKAQNDPNYSPATFTLKCPCVYQYDIFLSNPF